MSKTTDEYIRRDEQMKARRADEWTLSTFHELASENSTHSFDKLPHNEFGTNIEHEGNLLYLVAAMAFEAGELGNIVKKLYRDGKFDRDAFVSECGDVLWYLTHAMDEAGVTPAEVMRGNIKKLKERNEQKQKTSRAEFLTKLSNFFREHDVALDITEECVSFYANDNDAVHIFSPKYLTAEDLELL